MSDEQIPLLSKVNVQSPLSCSCLRCEPSWCSPAVSLGECPFQTGLSVNVHLVLTVHPLGSGSYPLKEKKKCLCIISHRMIWLVLCATLSHYLRSQLQFSLCLDLGCHEVPRYTPSPARIFSCCCSLLLSPGDHWLPGDHTANIQARFSSLLTVLHTKFDQRLHLLPARSLGSHCFPVALWDWCHPTLPFNKAPPLENLMLCTLPRSSRFYFLV